MSQRQAKEENAFFVKLSVLSNNGERIEEQVKQICKAAEKIEKYIEMLRGTGLNYTADSMARNTAEIKLRQNVILQIVEYMHQQQQRGKQKQEEQQREEQQHQFVKRYARFRVRCPKCR